ncbi:MG2 domain-containing protein [Pedobacter sp. NJ-S-72]
MAGYVSMSYQERVNGGRAMFVNGVDTLYTPLNNYRNYRDEKKSKKVILFTDRAIYRPGQTVFYKGLLMENRNDKNTILPAQSLEVTFEDVNDNEIGKVTVKTNDYGTFQGSFTIPTGKLNGSMLLTTKIWQYWYSGRRIQKTHV